MTCLAVYYPLLFTRFSLFSQACVDVYEDVFGALHARTGETLCELARIQFRMV